MNMYDCTAASHEAVAPNCPHCGDAHCESNHLDEALYHEAALQASQLVREGEDDAALEAVIAYYTVRKFNDGQPSHRCLSCGLSFDREQRSSGSVERDDPPFLGSGLDTMEARP